LAHALIAASTDWLLDTKFFCQNFGLPGLPHEKVNGLEWSELIIDGRSSNDFSLKKSPLAGIAASTRWSESAVEKMNAVSL